MKNILFFATLLLAVFVDAKAQWKMLDDHIKSVWADSVSVDNVLPEYPRPIMERSSWSNLNGLWDYAIKKKGERKPEVFDGKILVPFAVESMMSGVGKTVGKDNELWYSRKFTIPFSWKNKRIILNFGAVDWLADVWVNDVKVGQHKGGFVPFSFDITAALDTKKENEICVRVWDPTDEGFQPRGKQVNRPGGIWYTPVTGIWQTVWLEPVGDRHFENLKITPDIDSHIVTVEPKVSAGVQGDMVEVYIYDNGRVIASGKSINGHAVSIDMPENAKLWSPSTPFLYDMRVVLSNGGKAIDEVKSYTAMRKFSTLRDKNGVMRIALNNEPIFNFGPLDQGWWPDGLYTAPTDNALLYDIQKTKDWGFNMIRKHIKVEPARWYTYCDKKGIIVWQDMPSGDRNPEWQNFRYFNGAELLRSPESEAQFRKEWKEIMDCLYSYPCIGVWVPFNEAWGQFKTPEIVEWTKKYDPTRLVDPASGGNHYTCGDILDVHNYPTPAMPLYDAQRVNVLGEYGGIGFAVEGHLWEPSRNWGYVQFKSSEEVTAEYLKYIEQLEGFIARGLSSAVYTQTTDVEVEVNGLMTYDRKYIKIDEQKVREANNQVCMSLEGLK